ncbi:protein disulfide-isomerase, partial [Blastocystis sp. subtype 4]|uniref:protein disulfide-isomerase n=1 Tax=Blastocystis sp. subtype 4 TaxID=944170 RepID=UPI00071170A0
MRFTALLLIFALAFAEFAENDGVLVLNDDNFDEAIKQHESLLVKFYAPWCGHCKKLAPEYAAAAKELKELNPPLYLAEVDATACPKLSKRFAIKGYPTLKFFKNGNAVDYDSGRSKEDIVNYMKKKSGPVAVTYATKEELEAAIDAVPVAIVGYFESTESEAYNNWYG